MSKIGMLAIEVYYLKECELEWHFNISTSHSGFVSVSNRQTIWQSHISLIQNGVSTQLKPPQAQFHLQDKHTHNN